MGLCVPQCLEHSQEKRARENQSLDALQGKAYVHPIHHNPLGLMVCMHVSHSTRVGGRRTTCGDRYSLHTFHGFWGIKPESLCLCGEWLNGLSLLTGHRHAIIEPLHSTWHALGIC